MVARAAGVALLALAALLAARPAAGQEDVELQTQRQRLEQLQREIEQKRAEAARLGKRETSVLSDLRQVERELEVTQSLIETLEEQISRSSGQIDDVTRELARAEDELAIKRRILARRLRSIYELGRYGSFEVLLKAGSFPEVLSRYKYLRLVAEQDHRLVARIARLEAQVRAHRATLERARAALADAREARLQQAQTLGASERERQGMLARVKSERSERLEAASALERETRRIQSVLATLEKRRAAREAVAREAAEASGRPAPEAGASTLSGEFGALEWPVDGTIVERFGRSIHPVYHTEVINNGIDIQAPRGTPVRAVEAGEVVYADWNGGYGQMVILDHAGGWYSLYAHLDRANVAIGQKVGRGDAIGTVGETGSLTGPKLHFEIRKGGKAVDPVGWLKGRSGR